MRHWSPPLLRKRVQHPRCHQVHFLQRQLLHLHHHSTFTESPQLYHANILDSKSGTNITVEGVVGGVAFIVFAGIIATLFLRRKKRQNRVDVAAAEADVRPFNAIMPFPPSQGSSPSGCGRKRLLEPSNASSLPLRSAPSSASPRSDIPPSLTEEQADFINGLYNNNVPAAAVARVIARMFADRHAGIREWQHELRFSRTDSIAMTAPPSYDVIYRS